MNNSSHNLGILYFALFLLALNGLFSKLIPLDAVSITLIRSVIAAIALFTFASLRARNAKLGSLKQYLGVYGIGILMGLHWVFFFASMQMSTVAIGMLSLFTYPMMTVLLEPLFTKKKLSLTDVLLV